MQEVIASSVRPLSPGRLVEGLKMPRSTARRLVRTLVQADFVCEDASGRLRPSFAAGRLASAYLASLPVWHGSAPVLERLATETRCAAQLMIRDGHQAVVIAQYLPEALDHPLLACRPGASLVQTARGCSNRPTSFPMEADMSVSLGVFLVADGASNADAAQCMVLGRGIGIPGYPADRLIVGVAACHIGPDKMGRVSGALSVASGMLSELASRHAST